MPISAPPKVNSFESLKVSNSSLFLDCIVLVRGDPEKVSQVRQFAEALGLDVSYRDILTQRELEVVSYVAKGLINGEIANQLNLSVPTVKSRLSNAAAKLNVNGAGARLKLTLWYISSHYGEPKTRSEYSAIANGERLTPRQMETVRYVAEGLTRKEIADRIGVTDGVVKNNLYDIGSKLGFMGSGQRLRIAIWYVSNFYGSKGASS